MSYAMVKVTEYSVSNDVVTLEVVTEYGAEPVTRTMTRTEIGQIDIKNDVDYCIFCLFHDNDQFNGDLTTLIGSSFEIDD